MRRKKNRFLDILESYVTEYMPYAAGLSGNTIRSYKDTFRLLLAYLQEEKGIKPHKAAFAGLDYDTLTGFLDWLEQTRKCSVSTRNQRLTILAAFAAYAQNRDFDAASVFMNSIQKIPAKRTQSKPRTIFTMEEVALLLRLPDTSTDIGRRNQMILNLMYASGARAQEICDLRVRDVQFQKNLTRLTLTGKGNKVRRIVIAKSCADMLKHYLDWRGISHELNRYIFSSQTHEHMTVSCIEEIYKKYVAEAREQHPRMFLQSKYTPHTMRHTTATHMLEAGVPLMAIKNFLGHVSVATTERYAELSQTTTDKHIREWNRRWFWDADPADDPKRQTSPTDFLK